MKVFVTGISGSDATGYLNESVNFAKKHEHNMKVFSVGEMLIENINQKNKLNYNSAKILNCPEDTRKLACSAVFEKIMSQMKYEQNVIIDSHSTFFWNQVYQNAINWHYINEVDPDIFVTIIDYEVDIKKRLDETEQWKSQNLNLKDVLLWQNIEVLTTKSIAESRNKPHFIIPRKYSEKTLYGIMFHPNAKKAYISFPMSHIKKQASIKLIDDFAKDIQEYYLIFNPRSVELEKEFDETQAGQTIKRDLDWFIDQIDDVITFVAEPVFTQGGSSEIKEGHENCKTVYGIFPMGFGPFEQQQCDKVFASTKEFFKFLDEKGHKKLSF